MITLCFKDEEVDIYAVEEMYADITTDLMELRSSPFKSAVEDILMGSYFGTVVSDIMAYTEETNNYNAIKMRSVIKANRATDCAEIKLRRYKILYNSYINIEEARLMYHIETLIKLVRYIIRYANLINFNSKQFTFRSKMNAKKFLNRKYGTNSSKLLNSANKSDSHSEQN